jgi:uncharacterized protein YgbK (DUF1537 family)
MGASHGWAKDADSGVVRIWQLLSGISVQSKVDLPSNILQPREYLKILQKETVEALAPVWPADVLDSIHTQINSDKTPILIALDDDPTGTQTCHDIPVLTVWDYETLCAELLDSKSGFFILTNSRALPGPEAKELISKICQNISKAAQDTGKKFQIVLRGDSTLRGHFPEEPDAVEDILGQADAWILAPFFFQGGRYTINDVHYVAEKEILIPASQTPFALDGTFGYKSSNLRDYVLEKAGSRFGPQDLFSITLEDIRLGGPWKVTQRLLEAPKGSVVIVNAAAEADMLVFAAGAIGAEQQGKKYLYRTAAAFVSSRLGINSKPPMTAQDLDLNYSDRRTGGLIIAGSYVPKTTAQLQKLRERRGNSLHVIELDVAELVESASKAQEFAMNAGMEASSKIAAGEDVLVMTSRKLITGSDGISSLKIGSAVAAALVTVLQAIDVRPRYIIAKVTLMQSSNENSTTAR